MTVAGTLSLCVAPAVAAAAPTDSAASSHAATRGKSFGKLGPLTDLVIKRLFVSDDVAAAKFGTGSPIDDPAREQQELDEVRQQAGALGLDPDATVAFFQDQIAASKVVQRGLFARWTAHPDEAPTTRPDLTQIRRELDQLTTDLLQQLKATEDVRAKRTMCTVQLILGVTSGAALDRLDALHRRALDTAVQSVCPSPVR